MSLAESKRHELQGLQLFKEFNSNCLDALDLYMKAQKLLRPIQVYFNILKTHALFKFLVDFIFEIMIKVCPQ